MYFTIRTFYDKIRLINFIFIELGRGNGYTMIDEFEQLRKSCRTEHHCSHYSSYLVDFDLTDQLGERAPEIHDALGDHPFGNWPQVLRCYSRDCPAALTWFTGFDNTLREYLNQNQLRILGVAPTILEHGNNTDYFAAIFLGGPNSPSIECQNRSCNELMCQFSHHIDIHAKALHAPSR